MPPCLKMNAAASLCFLAREWELTYDVWMPFFRDLIKKQVNIYTQYHFVETHTPIPSQPMVRSGPRLVLDHLMAPLNWRQTNMTVTKRNEGLGRHLRFSSISFAAPKPALKHSARNNMRVGSSYMRRS